jgi:hypothetical protein
MLPSCFQWKCQRIQRISLPKTLHLSTIPSTVRLILSNHVAAGAKIISTTEREHRWHITLVTCVAISVRMAQISNHLKLDIRTKKAAPSTSASDSDSDEKIVLSVKVFDLSKLILIANPSFLFLLCDQLLLNFLISVNVFAEISCHYD